MTAITNTIIFHNVPYAVKCPTIHCEVPHWRHKMEGGNKEKAGILILPTLSIKSYLVINEQLMEIPFAAISSHCIKFCSVSKLRNVTNLQVE